MALGILEKIKTAELVGRGGAAFPTALKWQMVKEAKGKKKYVVINAAEGEPGVKKDGYILDKFSPELILGVKEAINFLGAEKAYFYINHEYYKKYGSKLKKAIKQFGLEKKIEFFLKPIDSGYIGGEESSVLNAIEGQRVEPRVRPPFPVTCGLFGAPTLINNVETFYNVALVQRGSYEKKRFYTINEGRKFLGVYYYPETWSVERVLKESRHYPAYRFFAQVGGDASGEVILDKNLTYPACGAASITIFKLKDHDSKKLITYWLDFFFKNSCGQCTPCREGIYRLQESYEVFKKKRRLDWNLFWDLISNLEETAFCGLGSALVLPLKSYFNNIVNKNNKALP